jgi:hypothetical protein
VETKATIMQLAEDLGLACIERNDSITVIGVDEILEFKLGEHYDMNLLTSPIGDIQFLAVNRPVTNSKGAEAYSIRLALDTVKDAEWIAQIAEINSNKPVTAQSYRGKNSAVKALLAQGKTLISAETKFEVPVYDKNGQKLEEAPMFFADSTGTAQMVVQPYTKSEKGGTINLVAVIIHSIESNGTGEGVSREERLAQLQAAIAAETKG